MTRSTKLVLLHWGALALVLVSSLSAFGWKGLGVTAAVWLLTPYVPRTR